MWERSLEESIKNSNRSLFGLDSNCTESDLEFSNSKKTDFAIELLIEKDGYIVPDYIKNGLVWLNEQLVIPNKTDQ